MKTDKKTIKSKVYSLLKKLWDERKNSLASYSANDFFPVDVEALVRQIKWKIEEVDFVAFSSDPLEDVQGYCDGTDCIIYLSKKTIHTPGHRRFTIAHEIGHAMLHGGSPHQHFRTYAPPALTRKHKAKSPEEVDADDFAAELLMPENTVRSRIVDCFGASDLWAGSEYVRELAGLGIWDIPKLWSICNAVAKHQPKNDKSPLTKYFGVTPSAMARRLENLRLVYL